MIMEKCPYHEDMCPYCNSHGYCYDPREYDRCTALPDGYSWMGCDDYDWAEDDYDYEPPLGYWE